MKKWQEILGWMIVVKELFITAIKQGFGRMESQ